MCTTFIVGDKATVDGSFLVARSADSSALKAQLFIIHPACYYPEGAMYRTKDHNGFQLSAACARYALHLGSQLADKTSRRRRL